MEGERGSFKSRGRIAQVLAQARASLKEPSRPYTPASLDNRTSLETSNNDHLQFDQGFGSSAFLLKEKSSAKSLLGGESSSRNQNINNFSDYSTAPINASSIQPSSESFSAPSNASSALGVKSSSASKERNQALILIINDINDSISSLETELSNIKRINLEEACRLTDVVFSNCDKLCKQIKDNESITPTCKFI